MTKYLRREGVVSVQLDGEAVLMDTSSGQYFRLNSTGSFIWSAMHSVMSPDEISGLIVEQFQIDGVTAQRDAEAMLDELREQGLVVEQ